jgi:hypothetical protein
VAAECDEGVAAPAFCFEQGTSRFGGRVFLIAFFAGILGALLRHVFRARLGVGWPDFPSGKFGVDYPSPMVGFGFVTVAVVVNSEHNRCSELGKNDRKEIVCDRRKQSLG